MPNFSNFSGCSTGYWTVWHIATKIIDNQNDPTHYYFQIFTSQVRSSISIYHTWMAINSPLRETKILTGKSNQNIVTETLMGKCQWNHSEYVLMQLYNSDWSIHVKMTKSKPLLIHYTIYKVALIELLTLWYKHLLSVAKMIQTKSRGIGLTKHGIQSVLWI